MPRVQPCKPWANSIFFHILWIELRFCMRKAIISKWVGKIRLAKTIRFFHVKSSIFLPEFIHSSDFTCHSTCPLPQRILLSKRKNRLYESHSESHVWGRFASAKRFCLFWSPSSQEKSIFHEISAPETCQGCNHANLELIQSFSISYGLSWGFACAKL